MPRGKALSKAEREYYYSAISFLDNNSEYVVCDAMAKELDTDSEEFVRVSKEIAEIKNRIALKKQRQMEASANENRMNEVINLTDILKNQPLEYDDKATRRLIDCIKVMSKNELLIIFKGGIKKTITI